MQQSANRREKMTLEQINTPGQSRYYLLDGITRLESVSEVLSGGLPAPHLVGWAARKERAVVLDQCYREMALRPRSPAQVMRDLRQRLAGVKPAHETELMTASQIGTQAHALIEMWLKGESYDELIDDAIPEAYRAFQAGIGWCMNVGLVPIALEQRVYDIDLQIAGTFDLTAAELTLPGLGNIRALIDWKTSRFFSLSHAIQVSVYRYCLKFDGFCVIVKLPKREGDQVAIHVVTPAEADGYVETFRAIKVVYDARRTWESAHPLLTAKPAV
jgi:hypothetical protein